MVRITVFLAVITLILTYLESYSVEELKHSNDFKLNVKPLFQPEVLSKELTKAENYWLALAEEKKLAHNSSITANIENSNELIIGETSFFFYGVFLNEKKPFILLKLNTDNMKKMFIGDSLPNKAILTTIAPTKIGFSHNDKSITFNLFERKQDDDNE